MAQQQIDPAKQKQLDESAKAKEQLVQEQGKRHENAKPTPTQAELDAAALGILIDEKEDDGGEDEQEVLQRTMTARIGSPMGYETRSAEPQAKKPAAPPPQRQAEHRKE
jgi:hypothetical protein